MWIAGLTALISAGKGGRSKIDGRNEEVLSFHVTLSTWKLWLVLFML